MCGIAGAFAFSQDVEPVNQNTILRLNDAQRRRGPDGAGVWASDDNRVVLGHRRLAIIDLGASGFQPMSDATGRWVISFNGEIYNYRALRSQLEHLGCVFRTNSDTEVLIHAVAQWGEAGLRRLRGMYAFALWDKLNKELWLVRDPFGIKPLYVAESHGMIWFASQARALANCAPINIGRDAAALTGFYLWGHVPEPFTWWAGIRMLPAGHVQRVRAGQGVEPPRSFHRIENAYIRRPPEPLAAGELRQLVQDSIQHHLVADVPVGIFLSSGIDSSVIASVAAELGSPLRTVTLAFSEYIDTADDEAPLAEATAKLLNSDHSTVRISSDEFEEIIDDFLKSMDQPTIDGLNTYLVSRATAAQGLKVALSGVGGDELFGGYPSFRQIPSLVKWGKKVARPKSLTRAVRSIFRMLALVGVPPKAMGLFSYSTDFAHAYLLRRALYLKDELDALLDESWLMDGLERLSTTEALSATLNPLLGASPHAQIAALESTWYMRNQLLRDTDWSSMAHGLEVRVPFADFCLLERLGPAIASVAPPTKQDLATCAPKLPAEIFARSKTGFRTPVREWIVRLGWATQRGLRGWAHAVHQAFRTSRDINSARILSVAAE
jgi:asparagine synthase (glutamine-hydrolysing)